MYRGSSYQIAPSAIAQTSPESVIHNLKYRGATYQVARDVPIQIIALSASQEQIISPNSDRDFMTQEQEISLEQNN